MTFLWPLLATLSGAWLLACGALWAQQERYLFPADSRPLEEGLGFGLANLGDGRQALFRDAPGGGPVLVYFHGNGGNASDRLSVVGRETRGRYPTLLVEYRGYGGIPGRPGQASLLEDAEHAMEFVKLRWPGRPVVLWGESLGTHLAVAMAARHKELVAGVVLDSPFLSMESLVLHHYPWVPARLLLRHPFDTAALMPAVAAPVAVANALGDPIIPWQQGAQLNGLAMHSAGHVLLDVPWHPLAGSPASSAVETAVSRMLERAEAAALAFPPTR